MRVRRAWWAAGLLVGLMAGCKSPVSAPEPEPLPATSKPAPPPVVATELTELGAKVTLAPGWQRREGVTLNKLVPAGPQPVLFDKPGTNAPLLMLAKIPPATLGEADPQRYPGAVIGELKANLGKSYPGLQVGAAGAMTAPPSAFESASELTAEGAFAELGLTKAKARFLCGRSADGGVWLLAAFAGDDAAAGELDKMIASFAVQAPAAPAEAPKAAAKDAAPKAAAPAPTAAKPEAPKVEAPSAPDSGAKAPTKS